ncbi:hypothetical protein DPMN_079004 [Dreissena polymorpha]|uniref:Uncharacterized protein n=1 Tax=Dreissena polymorpha TaxID=45954 RepID=A0A9D4BSM1_DREPO|nr:hypothetical protein DPMN_079004 [Dreissena polymorpha]
MAPDTKVPDNGQKDRRKDNAKTISLRLWQRITRAPPCGCRPLIYFLFKGEGTLIFNHKGGRSGVKRGV